MAHVFRKKRLHPSASPLSVLTIARSSDVLKPSSSLEAGSLGGPATLGTPGQHRPGGKCSLSSESSGGHLLVERQSRSLSDLGAHLKQDFAGLLMPVGGVTVHSIWGCFLKTCLCVIGAEYISWSTMLLSLMLWHMAGSLSDATLIVRLGNEALQQNLARQQSTDRQNSGMQASTSGSLAGASARHVAHNLFDTVNTA